MWELKDILLGAFPARSNWTLVFRLFEYRLMKNNTICKKSPVYQVFAKSPAAKIENYDYEKNDGDYSLWSESRKRSNLVCSLKINKFLRMERRSR